MALSRDRKEEILAEYTALLENSEAVIFTEYRGMTNKQITNLRNQIRETDGVYRVAKLTLLKIAMERVGFPLPEGLEGVPIAVGFCTGNVPGIAKALTDYAKDSERMVIRGGIIGNTMMSMEDVEALADLPPIETFQAQILGLLTQSASQLVGVLDAGTSGVVNVLQASTTGVVNVLASYTQSEAAAD